MLHLGGVLARFKVEELMYGVGEQRCDVAVQAPEEGVVVGLLRADQVACLPKHGGALQLPPRHADVGLFLPDQAVARRSLQKRFDELWVAPIVDVDDIGIGPAPCAGSFEFTAQA